MLGVFFYFLSMYHHSKGIEYGIVVFVPVCVVFVTEIDVRGLSHSFVLDFHESCKN